jgi:hypothetical protein
MHYGFNAASAVKYNKKYAENLGWYERLPKEAIEAFPGLGNDPVQGVEDEKLEFAKAVHVFQKTIYTSEKSQDGKLGKGTSAKLYAKFGPQSSRLYYHNGVPFGASEDGKSSRVIPWNAPDGLDLHSDGGYYRPSHRVTRNIVIHWGGISPKNCRKVLANKNLSSHFGVEEDRIYQWLDTRFVAYHAGKANGPAIGIDITQQPTVKWLKHFRDKRGFDCKEVKNTTGRGDKKVITLHSVTAQTVRDLVLDLCEVHGIPMEVPRNPDGSYFYGVLPNYGRDFAGIVGHFHSRKTKWDPAVWWAQIFDPLFP